MPYIDPSRRMILIQDLDTARTVGELNFLITTEIKNYLELNTDFPKPPSYQLLNEVIGVLECAKLELYRRMVATYEDKKIEENGDVY